MPPFNPQGNTITFTAAGSAPTAVQCISNNGTRAPQYLITNTGSVTVFIAYSATSAAAAQANAVIPTSTSIYCTPVLAGSQVTLSIPPDAYFTGITAGSSAVVYVTPGYGE